MSLRFRCHHALTLVLVQLYVCPPISVWGGPGSRVLPGLRPALQQWNSSFSSVRRLVPALATVSDGVVDVFSLAEGALQFAQTVALAVTGACSCSSGSLRFRCLLARRRCSCSLRRQCAWQSHVQCFTLQNLCSLAASCTVVSANVLVLMVNKAVPIGQAPFWGTCDGRPC